MTATTTVVALLCLAAALSPRVLSRTLHRKGAGIRRSQEAMALEAMTELSRGVARRLAIGETLLQALRGAAQGSVIAADVEVVVQEHAKGVTLDRAVERWALRVPGPETALLAATVRLATSDVGPRSELFDRLAVSLRRRADLRQDALAKAGQARLSGIVVASMPWVVAAVVVAVGGGAAAFMVGEPLGRICLGSAIGLDVVGAAWSEWQIKRATR